MKIRQKGFTLIELMVTLVVLGILLSLGIPSFTTWVQDSRVDGTAQSIATTLKLARSEAVARQSVVTLTWNGDNVDLYSDNDVAGNSAYNAGDGDEYIKQGLNFRQGGVDVINDDNNVYISFNPNGSLNEAGAIEIGICDSRGAAEGWTVNINTVGRVSMTQVGVDCDPSS